VPGKRRSSAPKQRGTTLQPGRGDAYGSPSMAVFQADQPGAAADRLYGKNTALSSDAHFAQMLEDPRRPLNRVLEAHRPVDVFGAWQNRRPRSGPEAMKLLMRFQVNAPVGGHLFPGRRPETPWPKDVAASILLRFCSSLLQPFGSGRHACVDGKVGDGLVGR